MSVADRYVVEALERRLLLAAEYSLTGLGHMSGGSDMSGANGVSSDGSVVVGISRAASGPRAFRWTAEGGMQDLAARGGSDTLAHAA